MLEMYTYLMKHKVMTMIEMRELCSFLEQEQYNSETLRHDLECFTPNVGMVVKNKMLLVMQRYVQNIKGLLN